MSSGTSTQSMFFCSKIRLFLLFQMVHITAKAGDATQFHIVFCSVLRFRPFHRMEKCSHGWRSHPFSHSTNPVYQTKYSKQAYNEWTCIWSKDPNSAEQNLQLVWSTSLITPILSRYSKGRPVNGPDPSMLANQNIKTLGGATLLQITTNKVKDWNHWQHLSCRPSHKWISVRIYLSCSSLAKWDYPG